jgi:uncharacterized protein YjbI with pentapeptide repeats
MEKEMFHKSLCVLFALSFLACEEEKVTSSVACGEGTELNAAGDTCEPTAAYREAAVEEGRQAGVDSVDAVTCADGTALNASNACEPTAAYRETAVEEGRASVDITSDNEAVFAEGVDSVMVVSCGEDTELDAATNICAPTAAYREAAVEEGRASVDITTDNQAAFDSGVASVDITSDNQAAFNNGVASVDITSDNQTAFDNGVASVDITSDNQTAFDNGVASVTVVSCAAGTVLSAAGDTCSVDQAYRDAAVEEGRASVDITTDNQAAFDDGVASVDITSDNQTAFDSGVASVTVVTCGDDTELDSATNECRTIMPLADNDFSDADVKGEVFDGEDLRDANFSNARVFGADQCGFEPIGPIGPWQVASFRNANLQGANFSDVNFNGPDELELVVHFSGSDLTDTIFGPSDPNVRADLRSIQFVGSTLTNAVLNFDGVVLVNFTDADLTGAEFREGHNNGGTIFSNTICPDGTNSDDNGGTCCGHLNVGTRYCQ